MKRVLAMVLIMVIGPVLLASPSAASTVSAGTGSAGTGSAGTVAAGTVSAGAHGSGHGGGPHHGRGLLPNGDFESPPAPAGSWLTVGQGQSLPGGWQVIGDIDLVNTQYFKSGHGRQSVDLNGGSTGGIWRDIPTDPGKRYVVRFRYSGNPDVGACGEPLVKSMRVSAGASSQRFSYDTTGKTLADPGWLPGAVAFRATGSLTRLQFLSEVASCAGPLIDFVRVKPATHWPHQAGEY